MHGHRVTELRSIELHRAVGERLRRDPQVRERAQRKVDTWRVDGAVAEIYIGQWERMLRLDLDALIAMLVEDSETMRDLRQVTPFAGVVDERTRQQVLRDVS